MMGMTSKVALPPIQPRLPEPSTLQVPAGVYLQPVPDHCDRITWRGQCYSLDHIVAASRSDKAELLSQLKVMQFHLIRGDFDGNKSLQRQAISAIQKAIDTAEAEKRPASEYAKLRAFVRGYSMDLWQAFERTRAEHSQKAPGFDECAASGRSCVYGKHGPNGETQCKHCGEEPTK